MAKKSAEKARKKRNTPTETENQGKFQAVKAWFRTKMSSVKGVAQPYLSLWELSRELQQWDKAETFQDCRVDLVGELP